MAKKFENINEEINRIKTLMFETDNLILNKERINESADDESKEDETKEDETKEDESTKDESVENESMDEQAAPPVATSAPKTAPAAEPKPMPKSVTSSFKVAKVSDINTLVRGGAAKFDTYKIKGTGVTQLFDEKGQITKDGMELAKKSLSQIGVSLKPGEILMRIGKKDTPDKDKVFFQIVPATELSVVTQDNQIKNLDPKQLDQLPVAKSTETPVAKGEEKKGVEVPKAEDKKPADSLIGVKLSTTKLPVMDITGNANAAGYKLGQYFINKDTKDVYRVQDGIITAVFKRGTEQPVKPTSESFNMDLIYINPLLFESVINEADEITLNEYTCVGDCRGQTEMSDKFTKFADDALAGKKTEPTPTPTPSGKGWDNYPCVVKSGKKIDDPKMGEIYTDQNNYYYSNGRFRDKKTGKMGTFKCDGDKITLEGVGKVQSKAIVVTDADLIGETNLLSNALHSAASVGAIATFLSPLRIQAAILTAGGVAFDQISKRHGVKGVVDALDNVVGVDDLVYVLGIVRSLNNKFYFDEGQETPQYITATKRFMELYSEDEGGDDLIEDVNGVGTFTLPTGSEKIKQTIVATINRQLNQPIPAELAKQAGGTESGESI